MRRLAIAALSVLVEKTQEEGKRRSFTREVQPPAAGGEHDISNAKAPPTPVDRVEIPESAALGKGDLR